MTLEKSVVVPSNYSRGVQLAAPSSDHYDRGESGNESSRSHNRRDRTSVANGLSQ